ncbi:PKD domain-containing protein [Pleomorphovibrio marinus]|uniref:PKD domain-containing protein n=1 Tax=Pleomorphovibrio marinus TaxID=2164132 RepID=UPI000E0A3348|nr:PKD domain-containing protein [Pleomorphovibrio marinus]
MKHLYAFKVLGLMLAFWFLASGNVGLSYSNPDRAVPPYPEKSKDLENTRVKSLGYEVFRNLSAWEPPCSPLSPLDCEALDVGLPIQLAFATSSGGLSESGFPMVMAPSAPLSPPSNPDVPGHEPSLISKTGAGLSITSTKGLFFSQPSGTPVSSLNTNSQVNALGAGFQPGSKVYNISLTLQNPTFSVSSGSNSQQAGIWMGLDEDHVAKLVVVKNGTSNQRRIQLHVENLSASTAQTALQEINSPNIAEATQDLRLRLEVDPLALTVKGYYALGTGEEVLVQESGISFLPVPAFFFDGQSPGTGVADLMYAGLFASHRNAAENQPITVLFNAFSVEELPDPDQVTAPVRFNINGSDYDKDGEMFSAENTLYLVENQPTQVSATPPAQSDYNIDGHEPLYNTRRFGEEFGYRFPIDNGTYTVVLHMMENFHTATGARVFDILLEGQVVEDDLDLAAAYGRGFLALKSYEVEISDGELNLQFLASENNAILQALEILPAADPGTPSSQSDILTFAIDGQLGDASIDASNQSVLISMPSGTDVSELVANFTLSTAAGIAPDPSAALDYSSPVAFTVTAEDGSTQTWTVTVEVAQAPVFGAKFNFQNNPSQTAVPEGYIADFGKNFGNSSLSFEGQGYAYGWKLKSNGQPIDVSHEASNNGSGATAGAGRNRLGSGYASASTQQKLEGTLMHFQGDNVMNNTGGTQSWAGQPRGNELIWELEVPNGVYEVTLGLGDKDTNNVDSRYSATLEGITIIPAFVPTPGEVRVASMVVEVSDGALTMTGVGGFNSKITHLEIQASNEAPESGQPLTFEPQELLTYLAPGAQGVAISNLSGEGATELGIVIEDVVNAADKNLTGSNEWLSLPASIALGDVELGKTAAGLALGETKNNTVIATAKGFFPALLQVGLEVGTPPSDEKNITAFTLSGIDAQVDIDEANFAIEVLVPLGTDVSSLIAVFELSEQASISPDPSTALDYTDPVVFTVTAADGSQQEWTVTVVSEELDPCSPLSLLDCNDIPKALPLNLTFDGSQGGLVDANGIGTGFTMVDPHSEARLTEDLPITYPNVIGYEPSKLAINGGNLVITATKGIAYLEPSESANTNTQVNSLGVGIQELSQPFSIETKLLNINTGGSAAQAGIWFGIDEDNFVKINVNANNVEIRKEVGAVSLNGNDSPDHIQVNNVGVNGNDVRLRMDIDPIAMTIKGFYAVGNGEWVQVTKSGLSEFTLPNVYLQGRTFGEDISASFAGVYATYRNGSVFNATFDYFEVIQEVPELALTFSSPTLSFTGEEGQPIAAQTVTLSASTGTPSITLSDDPDSAEWLILPGNPELGELSFGIVEGLPAGSYSTTVFGIDQPDLGYSNAELTVQLLISPASTGPVDPDFEWNINFSDPGSAAPANYEKDSGDPFGNRGNGWVYGWLDDVTDAPADLTLNGRNRELSGVSLLRNTLIHMQYGKISTNAAMGYLPDAKWEIEVPNGFYQVTVEVGDPNVDGSQSDVPSHTILVEGVSAISGFVPSGTDGSDTRFTSATVIANVADGRLTLSPSGGHNTKISSVQIKAVEGGVQVPKVLGVNPEDGAVNVSVNTSISANNLFLPNPDGNGLTSVDNTTITNSTVRLFKEGSNTQVPATVNGTGGGDAISLVPTLPLEANTTYVFEVEGVKDLAGETFEFFTSSFTTGMGGSTGPTTDLDNVSFTRHGTVASGAKYTTVTIGPDGKLYGLQIGGNIDRWTINADGTLSNKETLSAWKSAYGNRSAVGLEFSPTSTAGNLIAFVTHNSAGLSNAPDWDGKLSRLTGANLENEELLVTNLPRSTRDHLTNSIAFKPGEPNVLYFNQGSNSAGGAPDGPWGNRPESLLSAATLMLDLNKLPQTLPIDAETTRNIDAIKAADVNSPTLDGKYNPYFVDAPLTLYATGVRNAYDLVWHTNGQLYIPTNGTAGGSNSPASIDGMRRPDGTFYNHSDPNYPVIPAVNNANVQRDFLFRVNPGEGIPYFGHPNPFRGEFVHNRGQIDVSNAAYNGVQPDINYRGFAFDFEFNKSANGVIEYKSDAENGNLKGALLVTRYSGGSDIIALVPDGPNGDVLTSKVGIPGFTGFSDPLDLIEDVNTGNLYVSDYGSSTIVLLRPSNQASPTPQINLAQDNVVLDAVVTNTVSRELLISNLGNANLSNISVSITGADASLFEVVNLPENIAPQNSASFQVTFTPGNAGPKNAQLSISGTGAQSVNIALKGLGKTGTGGSNEPSLQWILDTYFGTGAIDVGDQNPATNVLDLGGGQSYNNLLGDELDIQQFQRASDGPVTMEVIGVFGPEANNPIVAFGYYESGVPTAMQEVFTVQNNVPGNGQTMNPVITGSLEFDPGAGSFGFFSRWPFFNNRVLYGEHALNTFTGAIPRHVRVYAVPGENDAYIIAFEEHISGFDYQDVIVLARNLMPTMEEGAGCSPISLLPCDQLEVALPYSLSFNGAEGGLANTGFTMVDNPSARLEIDGPTTYPSVPGFEPNRLSFSNGNLIINAANGIAFRTNGTTNTTSTEVNSQINTLGAGINVGATGNFSITTTVVNPYSDGSDNSEQAGIWFGLNEDNFVKLAVANGGKLEIMREINALAPNDIENNIQVANVSGLHNSAVTLRLYVDVENNLLIGYYSLNNGAEVELGSVALPAVYVNGNLAYGNLSFAGIYTSKRRELQADVNYTFTNFAITPEQVVDPGFESLKINFSRAQDNAPSGWLTDAGAAYGVRDNGETYGWVNSQTQAPLNLAANTRNRELANVSLLLNTLNHMQFGDVGGTNGVNTQGSWEIAVPNGTYEVTVYVGDPAVDTQEGTIPSHNVNVEGVNAVNAFVPTGTAGAATRMTTGTVTVVVADGKLTLDAIGGFNTKIQAVEITRTSETIVPFFTNVTPANNATNVSLNDFQINVEILTPSGYELLGSTLAGNVNLYEVTPGGEVVVPSNSNDTAGGDAITLTPLETLKESTEYVFRIENVEANKVGDVDDRLAFLPFVSRFTTGLLADIPIPIRDLGGVEFTKVLGGPALGNGTANERFTSLAIGPDGKLYGSTIGDFQSDGKIHRWDIAEDGTLTNLEVLSPNLTGSPHPVTGVPASNNRLIVGFVFAPEATANNLVAYVTHSAASLTNGPEWDGKLTKLSGPNLSVVEDVIIHLPRSTKDHLTNSIIFDEAGMMYISQGSNSAGGDPDPAWNNRPERLLSAAVLKLDLNKLPSNLPLSVHTTDNISVINAAPSAGLTMSDGTYNPYASNSPLTIYATGVRNAYDMLWHSNGWMYVPTNGTAGNNTNSPNSPGTANYPLARRIDGLTSIPPAPALIGGETQKDWMFKTKGGTYHGHPNPYRGEFILNHGGMPYSGIPGQVEASHRDVAKYPINLGPDPNYSRPAYDFGNNKSPNGVIEYKSDAFNGKLQGLIMVVRFSGQNDLLVMDPSNNGDIAEVYNTIPGLQGFDDPLDVVEDPRTGNIYISEYDRDNNGTPRLTLLRAAIPATPQPDLVAAPEELIFETIVDFHSSGAGSRTDVQEVTVTNEGLSAITINGVSIAGPFAGQFAGVSPNTASTLEPGQSLTYTVTYAPAVNNSNLGYQEAVLVLNTDMPNQPTLEIGLHALKKQGFEGGKEPTLDAVVKTLGIGINVGWTGLTSNINPSPMGEEVEVQQWVKAGPGQVNIIPVGRYSPAESLPFGYYTLSEGNVILHEVGVLADGILNAQTLYPPIAEGNDFFDPQNGIFGIYVKSETFNRVNYTQDSLNTGGVARRVRTYPMKDRQGNLIENSYLVNFEDATNGDYQDYMFIIDNVIPYEDGTLRLTFEPAFANVTTSVNEEGAVTQQVVLNAVGGVTEDEVTLSASDPRVTLPESWTFGTPFEISFDKSGSGVGNNRLVISATAENYVPGEFVFNVTVTSEAAFVYQFNFQDANALAASPAGWIDDVGNAFGEKNTHLGFLNYGWVLPNTTSPASAVANGRSRITATNTDPLLHTFTIIGHRTAATYPLRDWVVNVPNGLYNVNISVGDVDFTDSYHKLDVNGVTIIDFNQQSINPDNLVFFEDTGLVEVTDGTLRLSLGSGGVNAKPNYIRLAPINLEEQPPVVTASFEGLQFSEDVYRGGISIGLNAEDASQSGSITKLVYSINGGAFIDYTGPFEISEPGAYTVVVEAQDGFGNVAFRTYNFTIEEPSGAVLRMDNMAKIPGTNRGFPAEDYYTFNRMHNVGNTGARFHDTNVMRITNEGTEDMVIDNMSISDPNRFTFTLLPESGPQTLPVVIPAGQFKEILFTFTANNQSNKILMRETFQIVSNADNGGVITAILHGANASAPEGNNEIDAQQVNDVFGFTTNMRSIVNDDGTITPPNPMPTRPSSNFPVMENIDAGYEGDMIFSANFVQADPTKPVLGLQLAALHGPGSNGARFVQVNGTGTVGGINFSHGAEWYQSLLPKASNNVTLTADIANSINQPFRIAIANYLSSGGNNINGDRPDLLGLRVYKAIDRNGVVIPNEYIVVQDFIGGGCGAGSANCDWNDNTFYFINIRPEAVPTAQDIPSVNVIQDQLFEFDFGAFFDKAYPGNQLRFEASLANGAALPNWMSVDAVGNLRGTAPMTAANAYEVTISATDLNGLEVSSTLVMNVTKGPEVSITADVSEGRAPLSVNFSGTATTEVEGPLNYEWSFGDGASGSEANVAHTFAEEGEYQVILKVTDNLGLSGADTLIINVLPDIGPIARPLADIQGGLLPLTVQFDGSQSDSDVTLVAFDWDFGDGTTATGMNPSHTYTSAGNFTVTLTVTDANDLSASSTLAILARENQLPVAVAEATSTVGVAPLLVSFSGENSTDDTGIVAYLWDFGNGNTSTEANPSFTFQEVGTYEVTLTVTDDDGAQSTSVISIEVTDGPDFELRINAGGPELTYDGKLWLADQFFVGGKSYINGSAQVPALFQTERSANPPVFGYEIPVPNGDYQVIMHFAEIYWGATGGGPGGNAGQRIFDVSLNGNLVLDNFDINAEVGPQTMVTKTFEVQVTNGVINMDFSALAAVGGVNEPKISAFEILGVTQGGQPDVGYSLYLNTGSDSDVSYEGKTFIGDIGLAPYYDVDHVYTNANASNEPLFQSERGSTANLLTLNLALPVPNGNYRVSTYHNELYWGKVAGQPAAAGTRVFDIIIQGNTVKQNFDIFVEGSNNPTKFTFENIVVSDGVLNISMPASANRPSISGLAIEQLVEQTPNEAPVAVASVSPESGVTIGMQVQFTGSNSTDDKGIVSYVWNFGDGNGSNEIDPVHSYAEEGTYTVTLTVTDEEGISNATTLAVVVNAPSSGAADTAIYLNTGTNVSAFFEGKTFVGDESTDPVYFNQTNKFNDVGLIDEALFQTSRTIPNRSDEVLTYSVPVPNGSYRVSTYHIERRFGVLVDGVPGRRVFDISLQGIVVKSGLDLFVEAGIAPQKLVFENVEVENGVLEISMAASSDRPTISAIAIEGANVVAKTPIASFSYEPSDYVEAGTLVEFSSESSSGPIATYNWDFGDGSQSTEANPNHTFAGSGSYLVTLTVTSQEGFMDKMILPIEVFEALNPANLAMYINTGSNLNTVFEGKEFVGDINFAPVIFNQTNTFNDGALSQVPMYQSSRTVPNGSGASLTYNIPVPNGVYVVSTYHIERRFGVLVPGSPGRRVFNISLQGNVVKSQVDLFAEAGIDPMKLVFENVEVTNGLLEISMASINDRPTISGIAIEGLNVANLMPRAVATFEPSDFVDTETQVQFTGSNSEGDIVSYEWEFGDGTTSTEANPTHIYPTAGTYTVKLKVSSAQGFEDISIFSIEVFESINPANFAMYLNTGSAANTVYEGKEYVGDLSTPATYFNQTNTFTDPDLSSELLLQSSRTVPNRTSESLVYEIPVPNGTYTVSTIHIERRFGVIVAGEPGRRVFDIVLQGQLVKPNLDLFAEVGIVPLKLTFEEVEVTNGLLVLSMTASKDRPTISGIAIEGSNIAGGMGSVGARMLQGEQQPMVMASPLEGDGPLEVSFYGDLLGQAGDKLAYQWNFGDGISSTSVNPIHTYEQPGIYNVNVTVSRGREVVSRESLQIRVNAAALPGTIPEKASIKLYPNPAQVQVTLKVEHPSALMEEIRIFDLRGRLVSTYVPENEQRGRVYEIPVSHLAAGVYFVTTITDTGARDMQRLIIVK